MAMVARIVRTFLKISYVHRLSLKLLFAILVFTPCSTLKACYRSVSGVYVKCLHMVSFSIQRIYVYSSHGQ